MPRFGQVEANVADTQSRIQVAAARRGPQADDLGRLEVVDQVHVVAPYRGPSEGTESERVVKALDRAIEKTALIRHSARDDVTRPVLRKLVMKSHVERGDLDIQQVVFAGECLNGSHLRGPQFAAAQRFERGEVVLDLRTQGPGVLIPQLGLDRPTARLDGDRMRWPHVESQETERRQVTGAEQAIQVPILSLDSRRADAERNDNDCRKAGAPLHVNRSAGSVPSHSTGPRYTRRRPRACPPTSASAH